MSRRLRSLTAASRSRHPDPTLEKLMSVYKHFLKVLSVRDLILASPSQLLPLSHLSRPQIYQRRLRLNKGPLHFLRCFPHIFTLSPDPATLHPTIALTPAALQISIQESRAADEGVDECVDRLVRVLLMARGRAVPMRAVFRVWRELGLPDEFDERVLKGRGDVFRVRDNPKERNTHLLELVDGFDGAGFVSTAEEWRRTTEGRPKKKIDDMELRYGFMQGFPPGMRLTKNFRSQLKDWQQLPYVGPYEPFDGGLKRTKERLKRMEKRAVGIVHEFLSLTVEKMAEVEQVSQFRKCFGIDLNIRDLFLDHPGIFYVSTKGSRYTVFLREAYGKGRLIEPNPIYNVRMKLLELVAMRRRGVVFAGDNMVARTRMGAMEEEEEQTEKEEEMDYC